MVSKAIYVNGKAGIWQFERKISKRNEYELQENATI
jgi:hypothetical protein